MSLASLEMLEAELTNQLLLPVLGENVPSLSQAAAFESNLLQWRARRMGVDGSRLEFQIQLAEYIGYLGSELIQLLREMKLSPAHLLRGTLTTKRISWRAIFPSEEIVRAMLSYLDRFARYLFSERNALENRYQRGLNLVLKVVAETRSEGPRAASGSQKIQIALPVIMRDYLARLRLQSPHE